MSQDSRPTAGGSAPGPGTPRNTDPLPADRVPTDPADAPVPAGPLGLRSLLGGTLMGLANLVPGISGGTMLLAAGIYPRFIRAVAELSTLKFRRLSLLVLGCVVISAGLAVVLLAGSIKTLVVDHRWVMYSLFIGLTLGGIPVVWRMGRPATPALWAGALAGFLGMAALALAQASGAGATDGAMRGPLLHGLAGLAGASAMILPGVSGGYLLLVMGEYVPILSAIDAFKTALETRDVGAAMEPGLSVLLPVGIGVVVGVVAVSNVLKWLLHRFPKVTLGVLLGLLLGAVVGLWPFQRPIVPIVGETIVKGQVVTAESLPDVEAEDLPTEHFPPSAVQVLASLGLILAGGLVTLGVARLGSE